MYPLRNISFVPAAPSRPSSAWGGLSLLFWVVCACGLAQPSRAQDFVPPQPVPQDREDPGHFEVREANVEVMSGVYFLNAMVDYQLSSEARDALQSGVPLTIRIDGRAARAPGFPAR